MWLYRQDDDDDVPLEDPALTATDLQQQRELVELRMDYPKSLTFMEDYSEDDEPVERLRRYVGGELSLNISLLHHMNTGLWYMSFYNDALTQTQVRLYLR